MRVSILILCVSTGMAPLRYQPEALSRVGSPALPRLRIRWIFAPAF